MRPILPLILLLAVATRARAGDIELERVGTIGAPPPPKLSTTLAIDRDGTITWADETLTLAELRQRLSKTEPKRVLLRIDRTLPWQATQWLMMVCAEARIAEIFHAVLPEKGDEEGAMALFVPCFHRPTATARLLQGALLADGPPVAPAVLYAALRKERQFMPAKVPLAVEISAPVHAHTGHVLRVCDAVLRAGIEHLYFRGTSFPGKQADLKALVAMLRKRAPDKPRLPGIRLQKTVLKGEAPPMPPIPRAKGRAGSVSAVDILEEEELPEEEIEFEESDIVTRALTWLTGRQAVNGSWSDDTERTALALAALGWTGHAAERDTFGLPMIRGLKWLQKTTSEDTRVVAVRTLAFCLAYKSTAEATYRKEAVSGLQDLLARREKKGGWGGGRTTVWCRLALRAGIGADLAPGLKETAIDKAAVEAAKDATSAETAFFRALVEAARGKPFQKDNGSFDDDVAATALWAMAVHERNG